MAPVPTETPAEADAEALMEAVADSETEETMAKGLVELLEDDETMVELLEEGAADEDGGGVDEEGGGLQVDEGDGSTH